MKDEERLIEVMPELLAEVHEMRKEFTAEVRGMRKEFTNEISELRKDVGKLQKEQAKTNLGIQELRLSVMRLGDFGDRILRLEKEVFKKAS